MSGHIFDRSDLKEIQEAHQDWCAQHSIDPRSAFAEDAGKMMIEAFRRGTQSDELIAACDRFKAEREMHVRLGSPAIPSRTEALQDNGIDPEV